MKQLINVLVLSIFTFSTAFGQAIDESKMQRDIEVAENILATIMNQGEGQNINVISYLGDRFTGNYIKGYGVIFGSPRSFQRAYVIRDGVSSYSLSKDNVQAVVLSSSLGKNKKEKWDLDSLSKANSAQWIENARTFLTDYAHLIGQLQPNDKIVITNGPTGFSDKYFFPHDSKNGRTSVEVTKKELDDFHSSKISKDQLNKAIKVVNREGGVVDKDVQLMANIFETLYKQDLSDTYYVSGSGIYAEKMPDLGVIMQMDVYSSISERDGLHKIITQNLSGLTQEERDNKVKEMYPKFLDDLKHNIVQYGRTLKSIQGNEQLILNVKLTQCEGCGIPKNLKLSIKAADLAAFNAGKISEDKAIDMINVDEIGKQ